MSERVDRWRGSWESCDLERIVDLYADDAEHTSRLVHQLYPELGRWTLRGTAEIREYVTRGLIWFVEVRIEVLSTIESGDRTAVEYRRGSSLDPTPAHVVELIDWRAEQIRASIVFQV